ncbi:MAG TPA: serine hydrolase domain-containing protein, partial [Acidobacteriaceae bacterium]|nr:serine hydrolase domain-containing protein [Acidobacteriaceae bacterium]
MSRRALRACFVLFCAGLFTMAARAQASLSAIGLVVERAIAEHKIPGAVVIVGHDGKVVYRRAFGMRSLVPTREAMTPDTIFDMASLTKPLMTATAVMQL